MTEDRRVRSFVAIAPSEGWVASAENLSCRLRARLPPASWTKPASWHLTLIFLGEIPRETLRRFADRAGPLAEAISPGELASGEAVVFPPRGAARVLGVGFSASEATAGVERLARDLHAAAAETLSDSQFQDHKPFHPHVTLARLRRPWPQNAVDTFRGEVAGWSFPGWPVRRCVLYESRLEPEGAVHTPLAEWPLSVSGSLSASRVSA